MEESVEEKGSAAETGESSASPEVKDHGVERNYKRLLAERKRDKDVIGDLQAKLEGMQTNVLQAEGKKDELVATYKSRSEAKEKELKEVRGAYAWKTVESEVTKALLESGCSKPKNIIKLESDSVAGLADHMDRTTFKIDSEILKELVESAKVSHPEYFSKGRVPVSDAVPTNIVESKQTINLKEIAGNEEARRAYLAKLIGDKE